MLDKVSYTRQDFHRDRYVHHSGSADLCEELKFIYDMSGLNDRPISAMIFGQGGAGKTALLKYFSESVLKTQPCYSDFGIKCSVSHFDLPIQVTPTKLLNRIMAPFGGKLYSADLGRFSEKASEVELKLIIIDEFHGLNKANRKQRDETLETIKLITNKCRIPFILAGTKAVKDAFCHDGEFGRRFKILEAKKWAPGSQFEYFVYSYLRSLPIELPETLPRSLFDYLLHSKSNTMFDVVYSIKETAYRAYAKNDVVNIHKYAKQVAENRGFYEVA